MYIVYKITCSENGKAYVGYTSKTADERFQTHLQNAKGKRKTALYDAIRCYGDAAFSVETLLQCESHAEACEHEIRLIAELQALLPSGYNMTYGGDGVPLTKEQREAANAKKRGVCSPKQLASNLRRKGQKVSDETRAKLSAARKGKPKSAEWRALMSSKFKNRPVNAAWREAMSKARKGKPWTAAQRAAHEARKQAKSAGGGAL